MRIGRKKDSMQQRFAQAVPSPCIGLCRLGDQGLCEGCWRNGDEIARWLSMTNEERLHLIDIVLPQREANGR